MFEEVFRSCNLRFLACVMDLDWLERRSSALTATFALVTPLYIRGKQQVDTISPRFIGYTIHVHINEEVYQDPPRLKQTNYDSFTAPANIVHIKSSSKSRHRERRVSTVSGVANIDTSRTVYLTL